MDSFNNINQVVMLPAYNSIVLQVMYRIQTPFHSYKHKVWPRIPPFCPHTLFSRLLASLPFRKLSLFPASGPLCMLFPHLGCFFSFSLLDSFLLTELNGISPLKLFKGASSVHGTCSCFLIEFVTIDILFSI